MRATDPQHRLQRHADVMAALAVTPPHDDGERLAAFAAAVLPELPEAMVMGADRDAVERQIRDAFEFVVHTVAPPFQGYRGAPGLHAAVRNATGEDVTVVETHTPHVPFIFESLKNCFERQGVRVLSSIHPIFTVQRRWERIVSIGDTTRDGARELYCQFRIERVESHEQRRRIEHQVHAVLKAVFLAVEDFPLMRQSVIDGGARLRSRHAAGSDMASARAFLDWLAADNFVLLGTLGYRPTRARLEPDWSSARGVFRDAALMPVVFPGLTELFASYPAPPVHDGRIIDVEFCTGAHAIHHLEPLDDIVIRCWSEGGELEGAMRLIGRLAKSAFSARPQDIPLLAEKLTWVLEHGAVAPGSHVYRLTRAVFNQLPKRELLYASAADLAQTVDAVVGLSGPGDVSVAARRGVGYHALHVTFAKARYSHQLEAQLAAEIAAEIAPVSFHTWADCGDAALIVFYVEADDTQSIDLDRIRALAQNAITTWADRTAAALDDAFGPSEGRRLFRRYIETDEPSGLYREVTPAAEVPGDIHQFEQLHDRLALTVLRPVSATSAPIKLFSPTPLELVDTIRTLDHLGLVVREEVSVPLTLPEGRKAYLQRLRVEADAAIIGRLGACEAPLRDAMRALHEGRASNDGLNGLVLAEGLTWRQVALLRTLRNYVLQIRPQYTGDTLTAVLLKNSRVAGALFRLFAARFDPALPADRTAAIERAELDLDKAMAAVANLLHDEILRVFDNVVRAVVRTNFYQQPERPVVAVKIECARVAGLPKPAPLCEIYVHSPLLEGVHLRGGRVARGGIRWSDRPDDFRAEILGLMKTQMLKNAIIVPVGSKGGFVLKTPAGRGQATEVNLVDRYREFIAGLLDVTDNLVQGAIVHPPDVVRYDVDDPYLVVAADKGTAHLSDAANQVSAQYGFWLGDAFASGGSNGYDHKREGITARGTWASVEHHFRRLGIDPQQQPFTVVGIGDMAGDVFGNGLLQSPLALLVGAFNHQHIFLDPAPDPVASFAERQRLFRLPRSTWRDYDLSTVSTGGGVFDRSAKAIALTAETRALLGIDTDAASGEEIIRRLLSAKVDLLYNGGIGTYIKASTEDNATVGDRANDRVRINAADVGARVIGEGGNLGLTQAARLEYWVRGGHLNTDAVDNSGGVSMSDHEVNIKVLLETAQRERQMPAAARRALLADMTAEVSELVLADNVRQARALTLDGMRSGARPDEFAFALDHLIASGAADRDALASGPASGIASRGVPRPMLAVAMALAKNWSTAELLRTDVVDTPRSREFLHRYFPSPLRARFAAHIDVHPLRREIVATSVINHIVNHGGVTLIPRLMVATTRGIGDVVAAYLDAEAQYDVDVLRAQVLGAQIEINREHELLLQIEEVLEAAIRARLGVSTLGTTPVMDDVRAALAAAVDGSWSRTAVVPTPASIIDATLTAKRGRETTRRTRKGD